MELRSASFQDWKFLLNCRNDSDTRNNSHNTEIVNEDKHKEWLKSVLSNEDRQLFISFENEIPVGTIRYDFDNVSRTYELSWTVSPEHRGKGIGSKMVKSLTDKLGANVRAEIKKSNIPSIKIAENAGLKLKREDNGILYYENY